MQDYSTYLFGKPLDQLCIDDIQGFFTEEREESNILEFKSGQDTAGDFDNILNKKIIRAIASFLNSEGGLLIWGAPREVEKVISGRKVKTAQGQLCLNTIHNTKDQLINKVVRSISYMPTGIRLNIIEQENKYVYVFEIQESESKPHQHSNEYPIRLDGQSLPAPHYLVDSMFKAVKLPNISGRIIFANIWKNGSNLCVRFVVHIENRSVFINESNVSYQLVAVPGFFQGYANGHLISPNHAVLHYGRPWVNSHTLRIHPSSLRGQKIRFILSFGGEKGIALTSSYTLDPAKFTMDAPFDFKEVVSEFVENQSFKEKQEELGVTPDEDFDLYIKRVRSD